MNHHVKPKPRSSGKSKAPVSTHGTPEGRVQASTDGSLATISTDGAKEIVIRCVSEAAAPSDDTDRKETIDIYKQAMESYDRTIVTVASGALALSITFLHDVAANPTAGSAEWLWWGWSGLLASLAVIIISMLTGHVALEQHLKKRNSAWFSILTTVLNAAAAIALLVGFFGLAKFAKINMFADKPKPQVAQPTLVQCVAAPQATASAPPAIQPPPAAPAPKTPAPATSVK